MTAPLITPFGTRYTDDTVEAGCRTALAHLKRPIRHSTPGTLWERVADNTNEERLSQQVFDLEALA